MGAHPAAFSEYLSHWGEFFLLAGTAAVTLVGLLFVAMSLHLDALIVPSREPLLRLARLTLLSFIMVLVLSLMMLAPGLPRRIAAVELWAIAIIFMVITVRMGSTKGHVEHPEFPHQLMRQRVRYPLVGYGVVALVGVGVWLGINELIYWLLAAVCMILGNAVGTSWELLVRLARLKREDEKARGGG